MSGKKAKAKTVQVRDAKGNYHGIPEDILLANAKQCIENRFLFGEVLTSSKASQEYFRTLIGDYEHEVFYVAWLNNQHAVIKSGIMFRGTIDGASVHPREVLKEGLSCNAAAVIFAHNHPSGIAEPSQADISITSRLKSLLEQVDIRILDHIIVGSDITSMAERGLL